MNNFYGTMVVIGVSIFWLIMIGAVACNSTTPEPKKEVCTYSVWRGDTGTITCKQDWSSSNYTVILKDCDGGVVSVDKAVNIIKRCQ